MTLLAIFKPLEESLLLCCACIVCTTMRAIPEMWKNKHYESSQEWHTFSMRKWLALSNELLKRQTWKGLSKQNKDCKNQKLSMVSSPLSVSHLYNINVFLERLTSHFANGTSGPSWMALLKDLLTWTPDTRTQWHNK